MPRRASDRFTIASFPQQIPVDPNFAENTWATLEHAINEINKRNTSDLSFEQLYRYSYNMVLHKHGDFLYSRLIELQTDHLNTVAAQIRVADPPVFLHEIHRQWSWFDVSLAHVRDILMYMDRQYVKNRNIKTVYDLGVSLFRSVVINDPAILPRLSQTLLTNIDRERNGEPVDSPLMRAITRMLAQLGENDEGKSVYAYVFEDAFLERTRQFYSREATLYLSESTCSDYLIKASQRIQEERLRVESYLESRTASKVRVVTERELISKYMTKLIHMDNSGLVSMLRNDMLPDLRLMYVLFCDVEGGEEVLRCNVKKEVLDRGMEIVKNVEFSRDPVNLISAILALREKYDHIVNTAFTVPGSHTAGGTLIPGNGKPSTANLELSGAANDCVGGVGATSLTLPGASSNSNCGPTLSSMAGNPALGSTSSAGTGCIPGSDGGTGNVDKRANSSNFHSSSSSMAAIVVPTSGTATPDKNFVACINEAFERFINSFNDAAEFVSLYVDKLLRRDFKGSSDEEIDNKLDGVMTLFRYLNNKDAFQRYYQIHVTKRLLYARAASSEAERSFVSKMKIDCGYMYTTKMEVMFNDMKTSAEATLAFNDRVVQQNINMHEIDMSVAVLTTMSWPITQSAKIILPIAAKDCCSRFEEFYYSKHEGRRLTWQADLGTADIRGCFGDNGSRVYDFAGVPVPSMCILMLFNDRDWITYQEISELTGIPDTELKRHLQSLSLAKYRVLKKEPREKEVKPDDRFGFNQLFTSRTRRVKLQVISARKESEVEKSQTRTRIDDDRRPVIDTVIVRIMKHRKVLEHNKLIVEVTNLLSPRFEPNPQEIKKRIESLVEREYLERQPEKRQVYQYIA